MKYNGVSNTLNKQNIIHVSVFYYFCMSLSDDRNYCTVISAFFCPEVYTLILHKLFSQQSQLLLLYSDHNED